MSRLAPVVVSLALAVSLASCDLILPETEPQDPEVVLLVFTGLFEFDQDTVQVHVGDTLVMVEHPNLPEPGPRQVIAPYQRFIPRAIKCTDARGWTYDVFPEIPSRPCSVE